MALSYFKEKFPYLVDGDLELLVQRAKDHVKEQFKGSDIELLAATHLQELSMLKDKLYEQLKAAELDGPSKVVSVVKAIERLASTRVEFLQDLGVMPRKGTTPTSVSKSREQEEAAAKEEEAKWLEEARARQLLVEGKEDGGTT